MDFVLQHLEYNWDWKGLSHHPNVTMDVVLENPDCPWNWEFMSLNPNITMEFISAHKDKPWSRKWLVHNPNLTMDFVLANLRWNSERCRQWYGWNIDRLEHRPTRSPSKFNLGIDFQTSETSLDHCVFEQSPFSVGKGEVYPTETIGAVRNQSSFQSNTVGRCDKMRALLYG